MEERLLYMRERSNGFYGPVPYFLSKLLFDTLPLRLIPSAIMSTILFFMIGYQNYHKYLAIMLVFAAECGLFCLMIACLIRDAGTANLVAGILLLFQTLLSGMMINQQSIPDILKWIQSLSFLKLAYEALVVNDLADFYFSDKFAGKKVTVQASLILTRFGFNIQGYLRDLIISMGVVAAMSVILFILLAYRLRETR
jgi:ABC-type multidrug transport system permease subunit